MSNIEALRAEIDRCHRRLEIDHIWRSRDDGKTMYRVEIPFEARLNSEHWDGISCRDETIRLLEQRLSLVPPAINESSLLLDLHHTAFGPIKLGSLIDALRCTFQPGPVLLDDGRVFHKISSYRGAYEHLAIEPLPVDPVDPSHGPVQSDAFCEMLSYAIESGRLFNAYKGGSYRMTRDTPVWVSPWGEASEIGVIDVVARDGRIILVTKYFGESGT